MIFVVVTDLSEYPKRHYYHSMQNGKALFTQAHQKAYRFSDRDAAQTVRESTAVWNFTNQFDSASVGVIEV